MPTALSIDQHFAKSEPTVRATYDRILEASRALGDVEEDPKKTSIHLVRSKAFAGVAVRKTALILTLKSDRDIPHPRVGKREQASANRWHVEVRLERPEQVDRELKAWLKQAYALGA